MNGQKIVDFEYCVDCEYFEKPDNQDPCRKCLEIFTNKDSHKPIFFKEKNVNK